MKLKSVAYLLLLATAVVTAMASAADDTQAFLEQQLGVNQKPPVLSFHPPQPGQPDKSAQDFISQLQAKRQQPFAGEAKPVPRALYFLSFSIPAEGMKQRIDDAARLKVPATLRGFVNNNLKDTAGMMYELVKDEQRGGVQIDPTAYRQYGITAVPALVVLCGDKSDRIAGNISLDKMLSKVAEEGDCADVAKAILSEAGAAE